MSTHKPFDAISPRGTVLSAVAINGAAATFTLGVEGMNAVGLWIEHTRSAATDLIVTPTVSEDGTNFFSPQTLGAATAGAFPADALTLVNDDGATGKIYLQIYPIPSDANFLKIAITGTSADGSDVVTVQANVMRV